ncbi:PREDICTED: UDP-glycosyltransferase 74F1 [Theobroma cacao]|uniref:Glycosyltransferase n=1 Tax=Theobroma cacao TaxID=3641 RepID=A0AB32V8E1_THECC|nr:PREDICTED: UDP-glycosyltransferase 74F1 [Theobroma cacao]
MESKVDQPHVIVLPYPAQGHINPMFQFSKRLASKGFKATLAITVFISNTMKLESSGSVQIDTISDGYDAGGLASSGGIQHYLPRLEAIGSKTLAELIIKHKRTSRPIDCIIYDAAMPWALDVAKQYGLHGAAFFTQMCAVNYIYYNVHHKLLNLPICSTPISIPGLPLLQPGDLPSFVCSSEGSYIAYLGRVLNQFKNIDKADFILINTFYKLENEAVESMSKVYPVLTIGPTVPSIYLDKPVENDKAYGLDLFDFNSSTSTDWLSTKPPGSVIYVSFGSVTSISSKQMEEIARGLNNSNFYFLWVVRASEEAKLPKGFKEESGEKGLIVNWSPQLDVLSNEAVGCFFTHCGWNSTTEALSLGVPMVAMPQWTDQPTVGKYIEDVWKVGVRVKIDDVSGIVNREEIESCIRQVMEGERGKEIKENAKKWRELALEAVGEGGTSDRNIDEFMSKLRRTA